MRIVVYGTESDKCELLKAFACLPGYSYRDIRLSAFPDYDSFITSLGGEPPELIVIAADGAAGMEGVIAARNTLAGVPVIWLSDDGGFGAQSYRLGCSYFHKKPVSPEILLSAMAKCV